MILCCLILKVNSIQITTSETRSKRSCKRNSEGRKRVRCLVSASFLSTLKSFCSLLILAGDINPIDIISHLPVLSEEAQIPYVFVPSKEELGHASSTKRPTSCVMVCPDQKRKKRKEGEENTDDDFRELYDECYREVEKLDTKVVFWLTFLREAINVHEFPSSSIIFQCYT